MIHVSPEIKKFITENKFEMAMLMEFSLPYYLILNSGFYSFDAPSDFVLPEINKKRKVAFELTSYCHREQEVPLRESTFTVHPRSLSTVDYRYDVFNTSICIVLESFLDEKEYIAEQLKERSAHYIIDIMQPCLEFILYKYNESAGGLHTISPSVFDCSHLSYYTFYSNFLLDQFRITPNVNTITQLGSDSDFRLALQHDVSVWKAFFNESKYAYRTYDFRKSIIYSAIALESYISNIIAGTLNPEAYQRNGGNHLSIYKKVKFLIRDGYIKSTLSENQIDVLLKKITDPRNDMMHGKVTNFKNLNKQAKDSVDALEDLFNGWR
ncbi:hypothetical protein [Paenibacillus contaminans]|uniref:Uncharacterized protein n=1 Tax=Paenibacillus contaminans TaxID=450362 RepID=A0A329MSH4_9BACL|nr:hypothetical protein [Paenibacillus contaminans]RAV22238.1 hypothetical protein DQG23_04605 [Paenibacillus contaminans]